MAVSSVSGPEVSNVGSVGGIDGVGRIGSDQNFSLGTNPSGADGSTGSTSFDVDWRGLDLEQFKDVAASAGMDREAPEVTAAFNAAAGDNGIMEYQEFIDNFGDSVLSDDGNTVEVDNVGFQNAVNSAAEAEGGAASSSGEAAAGQTPEAGAAGECPPGTPTASETGAPSGPAGGEAAPAAGGLDPSSEAGQLLSEANANGDDTLDKDELKQLLRAAGVPEGQVEEMAERLMQELGEGQGIKIEDLKAALEETGAELSSKDDLKRALETVAAGEASQGSQGDQNGQPAR